MKLLAVELTDFRNLRGVLVEPHPRVNVLSGDNGQGKTNFLEGLFLVGTLASFRASRGEELVRFGAATARASARVLRADLTRRYDVEIAGPPWRKLARVDGKAVRATADWFGGFNVVLFVPEDLGLPRGAPSARRRFLDRAVWNAEPALYGEAQTYARVLKSRNALLRAAAEGKRPRDLDALLDVYDQQLVAASAPIVARRRRTLDALRPRFQAAWQRITASGLAVDARYESAASDLAAALRDARPRDLARGFTGPGPHGDDLEFLLDGRAAGRFASQGQLRALVLAFKIAEIEHLAALHGDPPILLLDDVSSELDAEKNAALFGFLGEIASQVFITTTRPANVLLTADRRDFRARAGEIFLQ